MIVRAVAKYLATNLADLTFTTGASTGNVFVGRWPSLTSPCVGVIGSGGLPELSRLPIDHPTVQVVIRGDVDDQVSAETLAYEVVDALTGLDAVTLDPAGADEVYVIGCTATQTDPIPLGLDDVTRCYEFSANFQLHTHNPTTHRPGV